MIMAGDGTSRVILLIRVLSFSASNLELYAGKIVLLSSLPVPGEVAPICQHLGNSGKALVH